VFETHATSEDNEAGRATGWLPGSLSASGQAQAEDLGRRRRADGIAAVFSSDLVRAAQTAAIAFDGTGFPILHDWRLRECDYGTLNGTPAAQLHVNRPQYLDQPYPGGESWGQAVNRVSRFLDDLPLRWRGQRVLVIGHVATRWALNGVPLEDLIDADFAWQPGWECRLPEAPTAGSSDHAATAR